MKDLYEADEEIKGNAINARDVQYYSYADDY